MKRHIVPLSLFLICASAFAANPIEKAFLYKLEKNGKSSYLFGTLHVGVSLNDLPNYARQTIDQSNSFICECNENFSSLSAETMHHLFFLPIGASLKESLSQKAWKRVLKGCPNLSSDELEQMRPGAVMANLRSQNQETASEKKNGRLDIEIIAYAKQMKPAPKIRGLEKHEDRILAITTDDLEAYLTQSASKQTKKKNHKTTSTSDPLLAEYRSGDLEVLQRRIEVETAEKSELYEKMGTRRNLAWMPKIESLHSREGRHFFLVGVAHLPGDNGLLKLAETRGFTVSRVESAQDLAGDPCASAVDSF